MEEKRVVDTNLGILLICLFSAVFTMADFIVIDHVLDKYIDYSKCDVREKSDSAIITDNKDNSVENKNDDDNYEMYVNRMKSERQSKFNDYTLYRSTIESKIIDGSYTVELNKDGQLSIDYHDGVGAKVIASNVLNYYLINVGQESGKVLYFVYEDGTVGKASNIEYNHTTIDDIVVEQNVKDLSNIVTIVEGSFSDNGMSGSRGPIFIDIDGNMYLN